MNILTELNENERKIKEYYVIKKKIDNYKYNLINNTIPRNIPRNIQINPLLNYDIYKNLDHYTLLAIIHTSNLEKKISNININELHKKHEELLMEYIKLVL